MVSGLSVVSPGTSKRKRGRKSLVSLKQHSMILRNFKACEKVMQQNFEINNKVTWNLEDEVAKVLEKVVALGFNFYGKKKELIEIIARRKEVNDIRFQDLGFNFYGVMCFLVLVVLPFGYVWTVAGGGFVVACELVFGSFLEDSHGKYHLVGEIQEPPASAAPTATFRHHLPTLPTLISMFAAKGLSARDMTILSGGHAIGFSQCSLFRTRIYNETNIDPAFATARRANCPFSGGDTNLGPLDSTPNRFDNNYYQNLVARRGLLHSDQVLFNGGSQDATVRTYSINPAAFLRDFGAAMVKMGNISPLTGTNGEIRRSCGVINS
ncbi:hypothetical protein LWI29_008388 [Acer saccharum]|uniref:Peroxidase n=1 Tax=Acer saccharum TaxID=4024 RepID=A0AA39SG61_ACESA|nr:hypothetical protein LWI29_008388 [Acer saccharum]